ncbi:MAG: DUF1836 domain-containing protein [Clostridia bacterium]|nr:DUF1836 domain-containing protein [Clostridia bacterium]
MIKYENFVNYKCPRWDDYPDFDLYMDQVVCILERYLAPFSEEGGKTITSAMINNYVKQKIVKPPEKKKYARFHLAYLFVVCVLKKIMSISEICDGMGQLLNKYDIETSYEMFCDALDNAFKYVFSSEKPAEVAEDYEHKMLSSVTLGVANMYYARCMIRKKKEQNAAGGTSADAAD